MKTRTPHLETRALTKTFGAFTAVSEVSLSFEPGLIHAVLGENGAGKSTLMKLLFGLHTPSSGEILLGGERVIWQNSMSAIRAGLGMVQQHFSLVDSLSVIDNIMLGDEVCGRGGKLRRDAAIARLVVLLPTARLAVPWHAKVEDLSVGEKQRVEILKLLFREAKILFLDEPTAVLAPGEIQDFFEVLRNLKASGKTIVLITHKINEVLDVCDTYTILRQGRLITTGAVAEATVETIVDAMIGRKLEEFSEKRLAPRPQAVLTVSALSEKPSGPGRLKDLALGIQAGEIHGIAGVEGAGQSPLVDMIMGLREFTGELSVLGHTPRFGGTAGVRACGVGLIPEDRLSQGLWLGESSYTNMMIGLEADFISHGILQKAKIKEQTSSWAREFDVRAASLDVPVGALSGGNQQKVIFAREVLGRKPRFLICYQPTRGVDLGSIDLIHRRILELRNEGLGVLLISSELDELLKLSDQITVLFKGSCSARFSRAEFDRMKIGAAMTGAGGMGAESFGRDGAAHEI